jgi:protein-tyrosine phosphatase
MVRVCFVCLGNICRSPTAEGVMRHLLAEQGLATAVEVDSAGTAAYHTGEKPDRRSAAAAQRRGVELVGRARQFLTQDWQRFDYVVAMDQANFDDLAEQAPRELRDRLSLLLQFDRDSKPGASVPDPYYGGEQGFDHVVDLCFAGCRGLIEHIRLQHRL